MSRTMNLTEFLNPTTDVSAFSNRLRDLREAVLMDDDPLAKLKLIGAAARGDGRLFDLTCTGRMLDDVYADVACMANRGSYSAAIALACVHAFKSPYLRRDPQKELAWLERAFQISERAATPLALLYMSRKSCLYDPDKARYYAEVASKAGARAPANELAARETPLQPSLSEESRAILARAKALLELDAPEGYCGVGYCYQYGIGTERDLAAAERCYTAAAERGHVRAYLMLAQLYGCVFTPEMTDGRKHYEWCRKAADAGSLEALSSLAECYASGFGTERDLDRANALLERYYRIRHANALLEHAAQASKAAGGPLLPKLG